MIFKLRQPLCFSEIGQRDNQEDFIWPLPAEASTSQRVFVLCDGVGGQRNGEVASMTAATALGEYLTQHWPTDGIVTKALFEEALAHAYKSLDEADTSESKHGRMGTTMTCLVLHRGGVLFAHIGDSRIYHIRPSIADSKQGRSGIIYQTEDHSLLNDMLKAGELTEEEAADFPHRNVITRAMLPHLETPYRADIYNLADVKAGDYFFLCSDGVLEQLTNERLGEILANQANDDITKLATIKGVCQGVTRDNHTCWLIPIDTVTAEEGDRRIAATEAKIAFAPQDDDEDIIEEDMTEEEEIIEEINCTSQEDVEDYIPGIEVESEEEIEEENEEITTADVANADKPEGNEDTADTEDEEEEEEETRKGFLAKIAALCVTFGRFCKRIWKLLATKAVNSRLGQRLKRTNRWQWIISAIIMLSVYDLLLFFFGDTSYSLIFPKAEPSNELIDNEATSPLMPRIEEYEAPKPAEDKEIKKALETTDPNVASPEALKEIEEPAAVSAESFETPLSDTPAPTSTEKIHDAMKDNKITVPVNKPTE